MYKNKISNPCYRESGISSSSVGSFTRGTSHWWSRHHQRREETMRRIGRRNEEGINTHRKFWISILFFTTGALKNARILFGELLRGEEKKRAFQGCRGHTWTRYARFSVGTVGQFYSNWSYLAPGSVPPLLLLCFSEVDAGQWVTFVAPFSQEESIQGIRDLLWRWNHRCWKR